MGPWPARSAGLSSRPSRGLSPITIWTWGRGRVGLKALISQGDWWLRGVVPDLLVGRVVGLQGFGSVVLGSVVLGSVVLGSVVLESPTVASSVATSSVVAFSAVGSSVGVLG